MEHEQAEITEGLNRFETEMRYEYVPGVAEFMQSLRAHGVKIAIVTSSNEKKMANVYAAHPELKNMVDRILTAEMFQKSKPDPDCFCLEPKFSRRSRSIVSCLKTRSMVFRRETQQACL